jgi:hypothetical protein
VSAGTVMKTMGRRRRKDVPFDVSAEPLPFDTRWLTLRLFQPAGLVLCFSRDDSVVYSTENRGDQIQRVLR